MPRQEAVMEAVSPNYPGSRAIAKSLVQAHLDIPDEKTLLAVYYAPQREPEDIFLFEIIENFGANTIDEERDLFEVSFGSTDALPLARGQHLHLVLTSEEEFRTAVTERWKLLVELREAISHQRAEVLHLEPSKRELWELLNA